MQNISARAILNIGTSVSNTVNEAMLATRFNKCELAGLVYVLESFINLEVLILNVVEDVEDVQYKSHICCILKISRYFIV